MFKNVCKILKINKTQTSPYHPQSNGALERSHRTLGDYLRNYASKDQSNWDNYLEYAIFCYNTTPHSSTNYSPFEVLFGFEAPIPSTLNRSVQPTYNYDDYVSEMKAKMQIGYELIRSNQIKAKEKSKAYYDKNSSQISYKVGDKVLMEIKNRSNKKLSPIFEGPYEITEVLSPENSRIKVGRKEKVVHNNLLKHYNQRDTTHTTI